MRTEKKLHDEVEEAGRTDSGRGGMKRRRRRHDAQVCQRWRVQQEDGGLLISWRQLQSSDTDVGAVRDAMSMAVSHHAADFADGLQDVNNCHRVTVVGFKLLPESVANLKASFVEEFKSGVYSLDWTPEMNQIVSASQQDTLRCCSSMAALSLPSLPNVLISDTCGEAYGLCESKLQSLFLQSFQHLKLLQWFHLDVWRSRRCHTFDKQ
ncbi:hypothetical protein HID58_087621 [Brassica napus]|uniref:Uncharacterized protein n=1 Tax=Brassica napus TaxID=3708 RepID=A0ABQ7XTT4_BRANA|nr:hypothetical protein HID58_087621 [Brassica napus]